MSSFDRIPIIVQDHPDPPRLLFEDQFHPSADGRQLSFIVRDTHGDSMITARRPADLLQRILQEQADQEKLCCAGRDIYGPPLSVRIEDLLRDKSLERLLAKRRLLASSKGREAVVNDVERRKAELRNSTGIYVQMAFPLAATFFGRHFAPIERLKEMLPSRPLEIGQVGIGLFPYTLKEEFVPGLLSALRAKGVQGDGAVFETFELAVLAGEGGTVTAMEMDPRLVHALRTGLRNGIFVDVLNPFHAKRPSLTKGQFQAGDLQAIKLYGEWLDYRRRFVDVSCHAVDALEVATDIGQTSEAVPFGWILRWKDSFAGRMRPLLFDLLLDPVPQKFDLLWMTNLYHHLDQFAPLMLIEGMNALKAGGWMVVERFDREDPSPWKDFFGAHGFDQFIHLMGGVVLEEVEASLQSGIHPLAIIQRERERTLWLDTQIENVRNLKRTTLQTIADNTGARLVEEEGERCEERREKKY